MVSRRKFPLHLPKNPILTCDQVHRIIFFKLLNRVLEYIGASVLGYEYPQKRRNREYSRSKHCHYFKILNTSMPSFLPLCGEVFDVLVYIHAVMMSRALLRQNIGLFARSTSYPLFSQRCSEDLSPPALVASRFVV
jgi:hypothetical protein